MKEATLKQGRKALEVIEGTPWKTVSMNVTFETTRDLRKATRSLQTILIENDCMVEDRALSIMSTPDFADSFGLPCHEYNLFLFTATQLIHERECVTNAEIFMIAESFGLQKCPAWTASQLELDCKGQVDDRCVSIGMDPIEDEFGNPHIFLMCKGWLRAERINLTYPCDPNTRWVFCRPRK